ISVRAKGGSVILPGDAHYKQISRDILPMLNYPHDHNLVVPHHGGKAGKYCYDLPSSVVTIEKAVLSYGDNHYNHPSKENISSLKTTGFEIRRTFTEKQDVDIHLN